MVCTAELTKENKEEIFLIYNMGKLNDKIKKAYGADGFALGKDNWSKNWILKWWNKIDDDTFDENDKLDIPNWEAKRTSLVDKWIIKIAEAQAVLEADSESSEDPPSPVRAKKKPSSKPKSKSSSKSSSKADSKSTKSKKKPVKKKVTPESSYDSDDGYDYRDHLDDSE